MRKGVALHCRSSSLRCVQKPHRSPGSKRNARQRIPFIVVVNRRRIAECNIKQRLMPFGVSRFAWGEIMNTVGTRHYYGVDSRLLW
ncbi:hypothetical protein KCP75_17040 [Salmonella enterica subsp. enterica]|nr:hypothetical protein KCP75_17040 [Salmonella enterica subsp. enterica]